MIYDDHGQRGVPGQRMAVAELGVLLRDELRTETWREGIKVALRSRFARTRVIIDRNDGTVREPQRLLVEWPEGEPAPTKFVLSTMPPRTTLKQLVRS